MKWDKLQQRLQARQAQDLLRRRLTCESPQATQIKIAGKDYLNFSSNDYLGLANHPKLKEAMAHSAKVDGAGSGASHLIVGHGRQHHALEEELADFLGVEKALLFSTGYMANLGVLTSLFDKDDLIVQDKLNHASLIDGGLASDAKNVRFAHKDMDSLERQLSKAADTKLIVTDGVFSMDGDIAPIDQMVAIKKSQQAGLMIDDAHGLGVLGKSGKGSLEHFAVEQTEADIYMATLGKAVGGFGAFVAGSQLLVEALTQFARSYIYTTAMPAAVAAANRMGLQLIKTEPERREQLASNIAYFRQLAMQSQLPLMESETAIQPLLLKENDTALAVSNELKTKGILALAIRPPTVPINSARLRITLSAEHSKLQIERLVEQLTQILRAIECRI